MSTSRRLRNTALSGGLQFVHYPYTESRFVDIAIGIGVGTRFEPRQMNGIAHFLEHILFRGSKRYPSSIELNREFERIGEELNAYTHREYTLYSTRVPHDRVSKALELLSDALFEPTFNDADTERGVILEEILEELDEKGREADAENISRKLIFGNHPLGWPVLGRAPSIKRIKRDELVAFHHKHYIPNNMVLTVVGGIGYTDALKQVQQSFCREEWAKLPIREIEAPESAPSTVSRGVEFIPGKGAQTEIILSFPVPGERDPGGLERMFLSRVLDDGLSSRLQRAMCERKGLLYNISCGIESFTDISLFDIEFTVSAGKLAEVTGLVAAELERLKKERMSRDEFEMVRDRFMRDIYSNAENPRSMANLLAEAFLLKLPFPIEPNEADGFLKYLTPKIIQDEAKRCFDFSKTMFVCKGRVPAAQRKATERVLNRYSKKS